MRTLFACSLKGPYGVPSEAYNTSAPDQQSLYPDGQHTLAFYTKCVPPVEEIWIVYVMYWLTCVPADMINQYVE